MLKNMPSSFTSVYRYFLIFHRKQLNCSYNLLVYRHSYFACFCYYFASLKNQTILLVVGTNNFFTRLLLLFYLDTNYNDHISSPILSLS